MGGLVEEVRVQQGQLTQSVAQLVQSSEDLAAAENELTNHAISLPEHQERHDADRADLLAGLRRLVEMASLYEASKLELSEEITDNRSTIVRLEGKAASLDERLAKKQREHQETRAQLQRERAARDSEKEAHEETEADRVRLEERLAELAAKQERDAEAAGYSWYLRPEPKHFDELITAVQECFPESVALPATAIAKIDDFKSIANAQQMAADVWRAIGAMHEYATSRPLYSGNFYDWCRSSGHARAYPQGDVAMNESDSTKNSRNRDSHSREFVVDAQVSRDGKIDMYAHVKFGGIGQNRPRLYFHDDTRGKTGKMHIGFLGPHNEVKNASSS